MEIWTEKDFHLPGLQSQTMPQERSIAAAQWPTAGSSQTLNEIKTLWFKILCSACEVRNASEKTNGLGAPHSINICGIHLADREKWGKSRLSELQHFNSRRDTGHSPGAIWGQSKGIGDERNQGQRRNKALISNMKALSASDKVSQMLKKLWDSWS